MWKSNFGRPTPSTRRRPRHWLISTQAEHKRELKKKEDKGKVDKKKAEAELNATLANLTLPPKSTEPWDMDPGGLAVRCPESLTPFTLYTVPLLDGVEVVRFLTRRSPHRRPAATLPSSWSTAQTSPTLGLNSKRQRPG